MRSHEVEYKVFGDGWSSPEIQASTDDETWTPLVRVAPAPESPSGQLFEADGALVWIFDVWDEVDNHVWSWIALSEDGGSTWTVSAGHPGMRLAGLQSVAANEETIVLAFTGEYFDAINAWTLPRSSASTDRILGRSIDHRRVLGPERSEHK